jgi:hypothetical protein
MICFFAQALQKILLLGYAFGFKIADDALLSIGG